MVFLIAGRVGTGKTFLATCFAGEIGIPCVKFLNFRSQWQGVTEGNLEKIFNLLKAMWPVAVIIDEADAFPAIGARRETAGPRSGSSPASPPSWGTRSSGERSSGSCSPAAPTCYPST